MFEVAVVEEFAAAHRLPSTGGKCERLHGHNWKVEVRAFARTLNPVGMVVDFSTLRKLAREVLDDLDHCLLNDLPAFQKKLPTAENLARHIFAQLDARLDSEQATLAQVRVFESDKCWASYKPGASVPGREHPDGRAPDS